MAAYTKVLLSGSSNGKPIAVTDNAPTGTTGTTIHASPTGTSSVDEVWLWAVNLSTARRALNLKTGGTFDDRVDFSVPGQNTSTREVTHTKTLILPGIPIHSETSIIASATATSGLLLIGYVNRITN